MTMFPVEKGRLIIEARREHLEHYPDCGGQHYTSARILSKGTRRPGRAASSRSGRKLPWARGTWPAIWMLPVDMKKWPDDGEIAIMEHVGSKPNFIHPTLHTGLYNHAMKTQRVAQRLLSTSCGQIQCYQLDWRPDEITIGFDDRAMMRVRNGRPGGKRAWPFDVRFKLILNLALGGDRAGSKRIDDEAMPQRMEVDHVCV